MEAVQFFFTLQLLLYSLVLSFQLFKLGLRHAEILLG